MTNLFVIGNGFDLAHGLKTSYEDFKLYLMEQVADIVEYELVVPEGLNILTVISFITHQR